jgi:hypothetical protein
VTSDRMAADVGRTPPHRRIGNRSYAGEVDVRGLSSGR